MSKLVSQLDSTALYLDTMIPYALLRGIDASAQTLFHRIENGEVLAYTSVLTMDELIYRLVLALIRDHYSGSPLDRLRNEEHTMIAEFYPQLAPHLSKLRVFPNLFWVDMTEADLVLVHEAILLYQLRPRDAIHLTAMQKCGCSDIVSHDRQFDRVPSIRRHILGSLTP